MSLGFAESYARFGADLGAQWGRVDVGVTNAGGWRRRADGSFEA